MIAIAQKIDYPAKAIISSAPKKLMLKHEVAEECKESARNCYLPIADVPKNCACNCHDMHSGMQAWQQLDDV